MAKRQAGSAADVSPHSKRRRLTDNGAGQPKPEEISSVKQLQNILAFNQDAGPETKRNIQAFKKFLESITRGQDSTSQSARREVLLEFLKLQPLSREDGGSTHAFELIKTWSFAAQSNNEPLFDAVAAVLALLLKTISRHVEFRLLGRNLCQLLLQDDHLKLLERGLSAQKSKDHLLSTYIRLLTEIVSFDGGSSAKRVYRSRAVTFKRLDTFLTLRQDPKITGSGSRKRPSVRNNALRYLFANLRLQDHAAKTEILANGKLLRSVFQNITADSPSMIHEIIDAVKDDVLKDDQIPLRIKGRILTDQILGSIATLYNYRLDDSIIEDNETGHGRESIPATAHALLLSICTTPGCGVLIPQDDQTTGMEGEGVCPPVVPDHQDVRTPYRPSGKPVSIKNHTLASFLQALRPYASDFQRALVLATFRAAPELVPDYFRRKKSFSVDPKLTATWFGFTAFLLATIQLPLPDELVNPKVHGLPPLPTSEIIASILSINLSSKVTSRCLNQNVDIIKFLIIKILSAAFDKFAKTVHLLRSASRNSQTTYSRAWDDAASALVQDFGLRCPDMSHVIAVFRSCKPQDIVLREASLRLLSLYYLHLPHLALEQKFDASIALSTAFDDNMFTTQPSKRNSLKTLIFEHLLNIARCSPDIRWWQKAEHEKLSLFGRGLEFCATFEGSGTKRSLEAMLRSALGEGLSMGREHENHLLTTLLGSLRKTKGWRPGEALFEFLDDCFMRLSKKMVKYHQDLLEQLSKLYEDGARKIGRYPGGELLLVVLEQWPFIQRSTTTEDLGNISRWFSYYLSLQKKQDMDSKLFDHVRQHVQTTTTDEQCRNLLNEASAEAFEDVIDHDTERSDNLAAPPPETWTVQEDGDVSIERIGWSLPTPPSPEKEDHPGLGKWKQLGVEEAISEGAAEKLILCLCSKYADIRNQALIELRLWMRKVETSQYSEREPTYLLLGELIETVNEFIAERSLSYFAGAAAAEFYLILSNPLHCLYGKVNRFLNKGPTWKVEKLPSYWVDQILMHLPTNDDAHYKEMEWLLDLLIKGLRTAADIELYRRCHIMERLLSLAASPSLQVSYQEKLIGLLFRCTYVDGSTTLITRYSLLSWVQCRLASGSVAGVQAVALERLAHQCRVTCDKDRIHEWSGGKIRDTLNS